jgi:hypothetical protein
MWRLLEVGEKREAGDEIFNMSDNSWFAASSHCVGTTVEDWHSPCRRKVADPVKASTHDPGDGWRLLVFGEKIEKGDQIYVGEWETVVDALVGSKLRDWDKSLIRRKVHPAVEPVRVGDRVEVVSGTWAKSCGIVVDKWGKVDSTGYPFVWHETLIDVRLDNVFVGGSPLTIRVSPSEVVAQKSAPKASVQVDPEWRMLEIGEIVKESDQFNYGCTFPQWEQQMNSNGHPVKLSAARRFRRRVRIESPGWRYLDAGETVRAGDETAYWTEPLWRPVFVDLKYMVSEKQPVSDKSTKNFRRKTAPFAG